MQLRGDQAFFLSLNVAQRESLLALRQQACCQPPLDGISWRCGAIHLGWLAPQRASWLARQLMQSTLYAQELVWHADNWTPMQRSETLQRALLQARAEGLLQGWRDERFGFWGADCAVPDPQRSTFLQVERSGFRFLGLLSHAVHVNGFMPDGRLWCGRRSLHKATDPGLLDNITAGGLPSGEGVQECLRRELAEEAGLFRLEEHGCESVERVRTSRLEGDSWHDEFLHVFNLTVAADFQPINQDGEVSEFLCLRPDEVLAKIQAGAFTQDAVQAMVQGLFAQLQS